MGDPVSIAVMLAGTYFAVKETKDAPTPETPELPAPVGDVDAQSQRDFTKRKLKGRKGRQSTILASKNQSKKTVLG